MREQFIRTEMLLGAEALERLQNARVALFGLGGVGGYTLEALTRSGVGQLDLIDNDTVSLSNLNRQILPETAGQFDFTQYDYIVDAIDTVTGKLALVQNAHDAGTPIISCMGTGNKLDASMFEVADITKTSMCPLARVMRRELSKRGIRHLKVVYSKEEAISPTGWEAEAAALGKRQIPGSSAFVSGTAGLILEGEVVRDIAMAAPEA